MRPPFMAFEIGLPLRLLVDVDRRRRVAEIRSHVEPLLANNLFPYFTDHSVAHSDRMTVLVDGLAAILGLQPLSDREASLLYLACYFHDLGMQVEKVDDFAIVRTSGLAESWPKLETLSKRDFMRRHHAEISAEIVQRSPQNAHRLGIVLKDEDDPSLVAQLCAAHTVPTGSPDYDNLMEGPHDVRLRLLSGLLRVADILEETSRRTLRERSQALLLDDEANLHWWRHYFTKEVHLDATKRRITVSFEYPPHRREEYHAVVPELQIPEIRAELDRHREAFLENGLLWYVETGQFSSRFSTVEDMPPDVFLRMKERARGGGGPGNPSMGEALVEPVQTVDKTPKKRRETLLSETATTGTAPYAVVDKAMDDSARSLAAGDYQACEVALLPLVSHPFVGSRLPEVLLRLIYCKICLGDLKGAQSLKSRHAESVEKSRRHAEMIEAMLAMALGNGRLMPYAAERFCQGVDNYLSSIHPSMWQTFQDRFVASYSNAQPYDYSVTSYSQWRLGLTRAAAQGYEEAYALFIDSIRRYEIAKRPWDVLWSWVDAVVCLLSMGRLDEARAFVDRYFGLANDLRSRFSTEHDFDDQCNALLGAYVSGDVSGVHFAYASMLNAIRIDPELTDGVDQEYGKIFALLAGRIQAKGAE